MRRDLGQGQKDKGPVGEAWMRHLHAASIGKMAAAIIEQVEIKHTRFPADMATTAEPGLDLVQQVQQLALLHI